MLFSCTFDFLKRFLRLNALNKIPFGNVHLSSCFHQDCHYKVLGVPKNATDKEIKAAYFKEAKKYHPDSNLGKSSSAKFQNISQAYDILGNKKKKLEYDNLISSRSFNENFSKSSNFSNNYEDNGFKHFNQINDQQMEEFLKSMFKNTSSKQNGMFNNMMSGMFAKAGTTLGKKILNENLSGFKVFVNSDEYEVKIGPNGPIISKKN